MNTSLSITIVLLVTLCIAQPIIKSDWTQVNVQAGSTESVSSFVNPRAAAFSDGRYIIVYSIIIPQTTDASAVGQIFFANGSVAVAEFALDSALPGRYLSAPNVVVFNDDTFLVVYRWDNAQTPTIFARRFNTDGTPAGIPFQAEDSVNFPVPGALQDGVELIGFADKCYAIIYYSLTSTIPGPCLAAVLRDSSDQLTTSTCLYSASGSIGASVVEDRARKTSYIVTEAGSPYLNIGSMNSDAVLSFFQLSSGGNYFPADPAIALSGDSIISILYNVGNSIFSATASNLYDSYTLSPLLQATPETIYSSSAIIGVNGTTALFAYQSTNISDGSSRLTYQLASHVVNNQILNFVPTPSFYSAASDLLALQFVPLLGGDLLVVAKSNTSANISRQILTFCGNGQLELNEECDGGANCNANCRCSNGLVGFEGICGLPNVVPVLDCVETVNNAFKLHFSFDNQDGIVQVMERGYKNYFTPSDLAIDRPEQFSVGSTLTYPVSAYVTTIPSTVTQFNWVLGSYNLTVDLTNITAVQCPTAPGFVADVTTAGYIYDGTPFAENFAARYKMATYRLTTEVTQTGGPVPSKRALEPYRYDIKVTVAPANETSTTQEPSSADAVKYESMTYEKNILARSVITDYKKNSTDIDEDLLQGYDPDSNVKDITPTPTGVEVRGNRYDSSNVTPPMAAPSTTNLGSPSPSVPISVSDSSVILPSLVLVNCVLLFV